MVEWYHGLREGVGDQGPVFVPRWQARAADPFRSCARTSTSLSTTALTTTGVQRKEAADPSRSCVYEDLHILLVDDGSDDDVGAEYTRKLESKKLATFRLTLHVRSF